MRKIHENKWSWGYTLTIIEHEGDAIVELSFSDDNRGVAFLSGLSVIPQARGRGLATRLLRDCEDICRRRGIFRIDLNSVMTPFVMELYHCLGYVDVRKNDDCMLMSKMLT